AGRSRSGLTSGPAGRSGRADRPGIGSLVQVAPPGSALGTRSAALDSPLFRATSAVLGEPDSVGASLVQVRRYAAAGPAPVSRRTSPPRSTGHVRRAAMRALVHATVSASHVSGSHGNAPREAGSMLPSIPTSSP